MEKYKLTEDNWEEIIDSAYRCPFCGKYLYEPQILLDVLDDYIVDSEKNIYCVHCGTRLENDDKVIEKVCKICGASKFGATDLVINIEGEDSFKVNYCLKCGNYEKEYDKSYKVLLDYRCPECGTWDGETVDEERYFGIKCRHCGALKILFFKRKYITEKRKKELKELISTFMDLKTQMSELEKGTLEIKPVYKNAEEYLKDNGITPNVPRCPKCGSTHIQLMKRKHSFWGGFRTEEVDRVCVNCKHRW